MSQGSILCRSLTALSEDKHEGLHASSGFSFYSIDRCFGNDGLQMKLNALYRFSVSLQKMPHGKNFGRL